MLKGGRGAVASKHEARIPGDITLTSKDQEQNHGAVVKLSAELVCDAGATAELSQRSIAGQIEFWAAIGKSLEPLLREGSGGGVSASWLGSTVAIGPIFVPRHAANLLAAFAARPSLSRAAQSLVPR